MFARGAKRRPQADWYWAASPEDRREYDAFGPWVDPVRSEGEMPLRFRAAYGDHRDARFLFKVPIGADRVDVRPGMVLYRMVLAVHDDRLSVLRLVDEKIVTRTIAWNEVAAIRSTINLLRASWSLLVRDGDAITIDYNAVSSWRLDKLTDFVRAKLTPQAERPNQAGPGEEIAVADLFFQNMLQSVRSSTLAPVVPIHFEPRDRPCRDEANRRRLSTGLLVLDTPDELIIVDRGSPVRRRLHPTYAARTVFVPHERLTGFAVAAPPARQAQFRHLCLHLDRQVIEQPCLADPSDIAAVLREHGVPQLAG